MIISRLKSQISALEKANFRLQIDNRDTVKDNKNLKRRNRESNINGMSNFIPKGRITTTGKENNRVLIINLPRETIIYKINLISKNSKMKILLLEVILEV